MGIMVVPMSMEGDMEKQVDAMVRRVADEVVGAYREKGVPAMTMPDLGLDWQLCVLVGTGDEAVLLRVERPDWLAKP